MASARAHHLGIFGVSLPAATAALPVQQSQHRHWLEGAVVLAIVFVLTVAASPALGQTFQVLHTFTGGGDSANPFAGVTLDPAGNLYGTTDGGGVGNGTVYKLTRKGSGWTLNVLYTFNGSDGAQPDAGVIFGSNGTLYGTTYSGGARGSGTVFNVRPFPSVCKSALCPWMETVLYAFQGSPNDGANPGLGDLLFDQAGNIYGTTYAGGADNEGTVYELTPSRSGWKQSVLHSFSFTDGAFPSAGVISDNAGNLYGTTDAGGSSTYGTVFELMHSTGWAENLLYTFQNGNDGLNPNAGLTFDHSGNLYGATRSGGSGGGGTVFKLTPSGGSWTYSLVYSFTGNVGGYCGPIGSLVMDGASNLYGTTSCDGSNGLGSVFKLTPSGNSWTYASLHDFMGGSDGEYPYCSVAFDSSGNLYGTTFYGGDLNCRGTGCGVVWEIMP